VSQVSQVSQALKPNVGELGYCKVAALALVVFKGKQSTSGKSGGTQATY